MKKVKYNNLLKYTIAFFLLSSLIVATFSYYDISFVRGEEGDAAGQHILVIKYIRQYIQTLLHNFRAGIFVVPKYDLSIGQGADIITTLSYYGMTNPIYWLVTALPIDSIEVVYALIYFVQLYLCGISFLISSNMDLLALKNQIWLGAIFYTFQSFSLAYALCHPFFLTGMLYLPLIIAFSRRVISENRDKIKLVVTIGLSIVSNFYFAYINLILLYIYIIIYIFVELSDKKIRICAFVRFFYCMECGILLSAPILMPIAYSYLHTYRAALHTDFNLVYDVNVYMRYITDFFRITPSGITRLSMGVSGVLLGAVVVAFGTKGASEEKHTVHSGTRIMIILCVLFALFPVSGWILNGFAYPIHRWNYWFILLLVMCFVETDLNLMTKKQHFIVFILTCLVCSSIWLYYGRWSKRESAFLIVEMLSGCLPSLLIKTNMSKYKRNCICLIMWAVLLSVNIVSYYTIQAKLFVRKGTLDNQEKSILANYADAEGTLYRAVDIDQVNDIAAKRYYNTAAVEGYNGISSYWSILRGEVTKYFLDFDLYSAVEAQRLGSFGNSYSLNTLASVRYVTSKNDKNVPFGYKEKAKDIYENEYALPIGYLYTKEISPEYYNGLNQVEKMQCLMQGIVLERSNSDSTADISIHEMIAEVTHLDNVDWNGEILTVGKDGGSMQITFDSVGEQEIYIYLQRIKKLDSKGYIDVCVNEKKYSTCVLSEDNVYYFIREGYLFPVGSSTEVGKQEATVVFKTAGKYELENIIVYSFPLSAYEKWYKELHNSVLDNVVYKNDTLTGTISAGQDGWLLISIPYSEGWKAYVDGKRTELVKANTMYMAINLRQGFHEIELNYDTPGMKIGWMMFGLGVSELLIFYGIGKRRQQG